MSRYEISFSGELAPGAKLEQVEANLTRLFQADAQRIAVLFSGRRIVIKQDLDHASVEKYRQAMARAGAIAEVRPMPVEVEEIELAPPPSEDAVPAQQPSAAAASPGCACAQAPGHGLARRRWPSLACPDRRPMDGCRDRCQR